ncbi:MAG TPA: efflux RND transporter permease subunit, partial [Hyphomicrobiaceae bacterium]
MPSFFIDRPIFAWVVAIFIMLAGVIAIPLLPVSQYPKVAPPQISVTANYPGASPEDMYLSVTRPIEEELNGVPGLIYFESTSDSSGRINITATFAPGTPIGEAQVEVQNRIRRVESRLPQAVVDQGMRIEQAGSGFLLVIALRSPDGSYDNVGLGDYLNRNVIGEIRRIDGVGSATLFATQRSMRIWMDPDKMLGLNLTAGDIISAIRAQNAQVAAGRIGAQPNPITQQISATVLVKGQLTSPEEFESIVLRANPDGSLVRLRDVATVEVGGESYNFSTRLNRQPTAGIGVQLSPTGNALATSKAIHAKMEELSRFFPPGLEYSIPYDTSPFVEI